MRRRRAAVSPGRAAALLTLLTGLAITAVLFSSVHYHERNRELFHFTQQVIPRLNSMEQGLDDTVHELQGLSPLFAAPGMITAAQFHAYTEPLLQRRPYIHTISFQRLVPRERRSEYETRMRGRVPGFAISEILDGQRIVAPTRPMYQVIEHFAPAARTQGLLGLDASSRFFQADAAERAGKTGRAAATSTYVLDENGSTWPGFILLTPVYRYGISMSTESPVQPVIGYVAALIRAPEFIEHLLRSADLLGPVSADVSVYTGDGAREDSLLFRAGQAPASQSLWPPALFRYLPEQFSRTLEVGGSPWHFVISPKPLPFTHYLGSLLALAGGVLTTVLAVFYMLILMRRNGRVQELVNQRTAELKTSNQFLAEDITERERVENALRHTQHILTRAQEVAHLGSWEYCGRTGQLRFSDEFYRICGLEPQSVEPSIAFVLAVTHPDDREEAARALLQCQQKGKGYKIQKRICRPDGSVRHVICQGEVLFDGDELVAAVGCTLDITDQKQTELALRESQEQLRQLAAHQERIREDERKRIAREVHDELGGVLAGIKAYLSVAMERGTATSSHTLLSEAADLADSACETVRRVITDLRPSVLDQLGIWEAIRWYADQVEKRTGLICECWIEAAAEATVVNDERSLVLFRTVQEALTNVSRHAQASRVQIRASLEEDSVLIEIEDDGLGYGAKGKPSLNSWGLVGMHERARFFGGEFAIQSAGERGTRAVLRLPIQDARDRSAPNAEGRADHVTDVDDYLPA